MASANDRKKQHDKENQKIDENLLNCTQNLTHSAWEVIDPTPNIHILFNKFNFRFFDGRLAAVELEWSKKMYQCAGICYQRKVGGFKSCIIRLSEPLLQLRSRKELLETLLHEMIHAFLFVLNIREGNGGHGPNFLRKADEINRTAGTNITVYHTFHDEVEFYKKHWWRCEGPCKERHPYFGYVKRTTNRAPGPNDLWWAEHQRTCGGKFVKVKEPTPTKKQAVGKRLGKSSQKNLISSWLQKPPENSAQGNSKTVKAFRGGAGEGTSVLNRGSGTILIRKPPTTTTPKEQRKTPTPSVASSGKIANVHGFKDIGNNSSATFKTPSNVSLFSGTGQTLGGDNGLKRSRLVDELNSTPKRIKTENSSIDISSDSDLLDDDFDELTQKEIEKLIAEADREQTELLERRNQIQDDISTENPDAEEILLLDDDFDDDYPDAQTVFIKNEDADLQIVKKENKCACCICGAFILESELQSHFESCASVFFDSPHSSPTSVVHEISSSDNEIYTESTAMDLQPVSSNTTNIAVPSTSNALLENNVTPVSRVRGISSDESVFIVEPKIDVIEISDSPCSSPKPSTTMCNIPTKQEISTPSSFKTSSVTDNDSDNDDECYGSPPQLSGYAESNLTRTSPNTIVFCPNCPRAFRYSELNDHLDLCLA